mgnify:CR=1 FL=1
METDGGQHRLAEQAAHNHPELVDGAHHLFHLVRNHQRRQMHHRRRAHTSPDVGRAGGQVAERGRERVIQLVLQRGIEVVLVSSGAIAEGMQRLGWKRRPSAVHELQAAAAVGRQAIFADRGQLNVVARQGLASIKKSLVHAGEQYYGDPGWNYQLALPSLDEVLGDRPNQKAAPTSFTHRALPVGPKVSWFATAMPAILCGQRRPFWA